MFRQNQLFEGLIHVMNHAFIDYIGPLEVELFKFALCYSNFKELCEALSKFAGKTLLSDFEIALGNKVLLYLSCCLAGRVFPYGSQLPSELVDVVPIETYKFMVSVRSKDPSKQNERFPHLRLFLRFDANQFLNVICTCIDAPLFSNQNNGKR